MGIKIYFYIVMLTFSPVIVALPKVTVSFGDSNGFARIKIKNETINASFLKTHTGFTLQTQNSKKDILYSINETGLIQRKKKNNIKK